MTRRHLISTALGTAAATALPSLAAPARPTFIPKIQWRDLGGGATTCDMVWCGDWCWVPHPIPEKGEWVSRTEVDERYKTFSFITTPATP